MRTSMRKSGLLRFHVRRLLRKHMPGHVSISHVHELRRSVRKRVRSGVSELRIRVRFVRKHVRDLCEYVLDREHAMSKQRRPIAG